MKKDNSTPESGSTFSNNLSKAKKEFDELKPADLENILDNLLDRDNDHGVMVAHDAAVPDSAAAC